MKKKIALITLLLASLLLLTACLPGGGSYTPEAPAGFFWGIWHGWVAPVSLILMVFGDNQTTIFEMYNTGLGYNFGFYIAVISGFGGLSIFRRSKD